MTSIQQLKSEENELDLRIARLTAERNVLRENLERAKQKNFVPPRWIWPLVTVYANWAAGSTRKHKTVQTKTGHKKVNGPTTTHTDISSIKLKQSSKSKPGSNTASKRLADSHASSHDQKKMKLSQEVSGARSGGATFAKRPLLSTTPLAEKEDSAKNSHGNLKRKKSKLSHSPPDMTQAGSKQPTSHLQVAEGKSLNVSSNRSSGNSRPVLTPSSGATHEAEKHDGEGDKNGANSVPANMPTFGKVDMPTLGPRGSVKIKPSTPEPEDIADEIDAAIDSDDSAEESEENMRAPNDDDFDSEASPTLIMDTGHSDSE